MKSYKLGVGAPTQIVNTHYLPKLVGVQTFFKDRMALTPEWKRDVRRLRGAPKSIRAKHGTNNHSARMRPTVPHISLLDGAEPNPFYQMEDAE